MIGSDHATSGDRRVLLVLDYPGRRAEAAIADLGLEDHCFVPVYLLRSPLPLESSGSRYARALLSRVSEGTTVAAVLAYCLAAPVGHEIATKLSAGTAPCPLILFDAAPGSTETVVTTCRSAIAQLGGEGSDAARELVALAESAVMQSDGLVDRMRGALLDLATVALLEDDDEPEDVAETANQLTARHLEWILHVTAAANTRLPAWGGDVLHVTSRNHPMRADWPGAAGTRTIRIDCDRATLLRQTDTREAVIAWLDAHVPVMKRR